MIERAIENLVKSLKGVDNLYVIGVATYALHLADHASKNEALEQFNNLAKTDGKQQIFYE